MGHKSVSPAVALIVVLIIMIVIITVGWLIFHPKAFFSAVELGKSLTGTEKARTAEAPPASEVKPQPGMVVGWKSEQLLPEFVKVQIVLDKPIETNWEGREVVWSGHGLFAYKGKKAEIGFDPEHARNNYYATFVWKVWREDEELACGLLRFPQNCSYPTPIGQDVVIGEITWVETVRLTE